MKKEPSDDLQFYLIVTLCCGAFSILVPNVSVYIASTLLVVFPLAVLVMPNRAYFTAYLGYVGLPLTYVFSVFSITTNDGSIGFFFWFLAFIIFLTAITITIREAATRASKAMTSKDEIHSPPKTDQEIWNFLKCAYGGVAAFILCYILAKTFQGSWYTWHPYAIICVIIALAHTFYKHTPYATAGFKYTLIMLSTISLIYPLSVTGKAKTIAQDKPYCLYLESKKIGKDGVARSWMDLTALTMNRGTKLYLLDGERAKTHRWSYTDREFKAAKISNIIPCKPVENFANGFFMQNSALEDGEFILNNQKIHLPKKITHSVYDTYATINHLGIDKEKFPNLVKFTTRFGKNQIHFNSLKNKLEKHMNVNDNKIVVAKQDYAGLTHHEVRYKDATDGTSWKNIYFSKNKEGELKTIIWGWGNENKPRNKQRYSFSMIHNDLTIILTMNGSNIQHWKAIQNDAQRLLESFSKKSKN